MDQMVPADLRGRLHHQHPCTAPKPVAPGRCTNRHEGSIFDADQGASRYHHERVSDARSATAWIEPLSYPRRPAIATAASAPRAEYRRKGAACRQPDHIRTGRLADSSAVTARPRRSAGRRARRRLRDTDAAATARLGPQDRRERVPRKRSRVPLRSASPHRSHHRIPNKNSLFRYMARTPGGHPRGQVHAEAAGSCGNSRNS